MKMCNYLSLAVIQFVADGDSRFRLQMMLMGAYDLIADSLAQINSRALERNLTSLVRESQVCGWTIHPPSLMEMFHFIANANELKISTIASCNIKKDPHEPFSADPNTTVHFYLFIRVLSDVFRVLAPFLGGIPRSPCQDQSHWLRKMVKISLLSTKPLFFRNYPALFSHVVQIYNLGAEYGLLKNDTDMHNKSDQNSAERLISEDIFIGLQRMPWSDGTSFLLLIGKRGFEAWWKVDLSITERICNVYFVSKVVQLWRQYQEQCGLNLRETFISEELYRDTLLCSSLPQLAVAFKLSFPTSLFYLGDLVSIPWKTISVKLGE